MHQRTTIAGALLRLGGVYLRARPRRALGAAAVALGLGALAAGRCGREGLRVATFNIENFPKSSGQERLAFEAIGGLGAPVIGVQEIVDPGVFSEAARRRLGASWRFVFPDVGPQQRVGVLFDESALSLLSTRVYREIELYPGAKPAFEARLSGRGGVLRVVVVHLKAGGDSVARRREQLRALKPVVEAGMRSGERLVVLGDFNATSDDDRAEIAALSAATGVSWATRALGCTAYWARNDGCRGQALDHALTWAPAAGAAARGPCETEGCSPGQRCPVFREQVSDHCPVTIDLP